MRPALAGLTLRGRAFLACGGVTAVVALGLGQRDLLRVGVLLLALPLVSAAVVARTRFRLASSRRVAPSRVPVGTEATVTVDVENVSRLPTGLLLVEDVVPYVLGTRPRFVVDRVEPHGRRSVTYRVRSDVRGRYPLGPLALRLTDPFGMVELRRSFATRDTLVVTPQVHRLPAVPLGGEWAGGGDSLARSVAAAGDDDVATREYRLGDPLHRVHWRSTARLGELMVRREEQPWQSRCTLLLDVRASAHRGEGLQSSFEWAVSAAASIGIHLAHRGVALRLITDSGAGVTSAAHDPALGVGDFEGALLDALAVVTPSANRTLRGAFDGLRRGGGDGLLVAVLGLLDAEETTALARLRHGGTSAVAVLLDATSWIALPARTRAAAAETYAGQAAVLGSAGWRVLSVRADDQLPAVWPRAAHHLSGGARAAAPSPGRAG